MRSRVGICAIVLSSTLLVAGLASAQTTPHYVLVHGINTEGPVWNDTATKAVIQARDPGAPLIHPTVGWKNNIDTQIQNLYTALNEGSYASRSDIVAIGYSLGGVVSRAFLREQAGRASGPKLGTLITMGSPHGGAPILNALNAETWARFSGTLYVIAQILLHPQGYLTLEACNGFPECIIYRGVIDREKYFTLSWSLASGLLFKRLKETKDAASTEQYKPQSAYLGALNSATGYENGLNVACIYGVEASPELWFLAASAIPGQNKLAFKGLIDEVKAKCLYRAINNIITCGDWLGFTEWIAKYHMVESAPRYWRKIVTGGSGGGSDGVVPQSSQQWSRAQLNVRVDGSNHLDHMNHSVLNTRVRELLDQFGVGSAPPSSISFTLGGPTTRAPFQSGTWSVTGIAGGVGPYSVQWAKYRHCCINEPMQGPTVEVANPNPTIENLPCCEWWDIGGNSTSISGVLDEVSFSLRATVTDSQGRIGQRTIAVSVGDDLQQPVAEESRGSFSPDRTPEGVALSLGSLAPNPVTTGGRFSLALPHAEHATVSVFDVAGREVAVLADREFPAGISQIPIDASHLPVGSYTCRLRVGADVRTRRFTVVR